MSAGEKFGILFACAVVGCAVAQIVETHGKTLTGWIFLFVGFGLVGISIANAAS